jgi:hypothetical protein
MGHAMNRGDQREAVLRDDQDRRKFLWTLGEASQKTEWQVHAYRLMSEAFRQELLAVAVKRVDLNHSAAERQETGVQKTERIAREELGRMGRSVNEIVLFCCPRRDKCINLGAWLTRAA